MLKDERRFYVYAHKKADSGAIFYIGKGCGRRASKTIGRSWFWRNIVAKHGFTIEYLATGLSETEAFDFESAAIARHGRENLCNLTNGGEGMSGHVKSQSARDAVSRAHLGQTHSPEWRKAQSDGLRGKPKSVETKLRIAAKLRGRRLPDETRKAMSESRKGMKFTDQHRTNLSRSWADPEQNARRRAAMTEARKGVAVVCVDKDITFAKIADAVRWLRTDFPAARHPHITGCCRGKRETAYGYRWRYA